MHLRPAHEVPALVMERLEGRGETSQALFTSMTIDFSDNPVTEAFVKYGRPEDMLAIDDYGHLYGPSLTLEGIGEHREARARFEEEFPGVYMVLGQPSRLEMIRGAFINRSHIKAYRIGSSILSLGGVNAVSSSYEFVDLMADFESPRFNDFLDRFVGREGDLRDEPAAGEVFSIDDKSEVLIDYGKKGQSIVYETLLRDLGQDTSSVQFSSSYIPVGRLDRILALHQRSGKKVNIYTNRAEKFRSPTQSPLERLLQKFNNFSGQAAWVDNHPDKFNHLKAVVIVPEKGEKIAYLASNTFHELPIWAGTAEVGLRTTDPDLVGEIETYMVDNLDSN